jgi:hypothetical protein
MGLFDFFKKKEDKVILATGSTVNSFEENIRSAIIKLDESGYFKYADLNDVAVLREEIFNSLKSDSHLSTIWNEQKPYNSKDYRYYSLDNETLFEEGGFTSYFKDFEYLFNKIGLEFNVTNHIEEWDMENECVNHSITINEKDYIVFSNFKGEGWGEAAYKFAEILNDQLSIQKKDERLYLASGGNEGYAVVLTETQFDLLDPILKNKYDRPLKINDWCTAMQVNPLN